MLKGIHIENEQGDALTLREVTKENWRATLRLTVHPEQQRFISDTVPITAIALAKAYIRPRGLLWLPYAFYLQEQIIGFTELAFEPESSDNYWIFHFFIDVLYQGQGYGKKALLLFLDFIKQQHPTCCAISLTVHPENKRAQHLYAGVGFQPTGGKMEEEPIYRLVLSRPGSQPSTGDLL